MHGKIAWAFSAKAFEASRDERFPRLVKHALVRGGVVLFWVALTLDRRAIEVWREQRAQRALLRPQPNVQAAARPWVAKVNQILRWGRGGHCLPVPAWSLPDSPKMRGLGLGHMWTVLCPYCDEFHTHSPGEGRRTPHCCSERDRLHYVLEFSGSLPVEHRTRFYRSSKSGLPRLLHRWPEARERHTEIAGLLAA